MASEAYTSIFLLAILLMFDSSQILFYVINQGPLCINAHVHSLKTGLIVES